MQIYILLLFDVVFGKGQKDTLAPVFLLRAARAIPSPSESTSLYSVARKLGLRSERENKTKTSRGMGRGKFPSPADYGVLGSVISSPGGITGKNGRSALSA